MPGEPQGHPASGAWLEADRPAAAAGAACRGVEAVGGCRWPCGLLSERAGTQTNRQAHKCPSQFRLTGCAAERQTRPPSAKLSTSSKLTLWAQWARVSLSERGLRPELLGDQTCFTWRGQACRRAINTGCPGRTFCTAPGWQPRVRGGPQRARSGGAVADLSSLRRSRAADRQARHLLQSPEQARRPGGAARALQESSAGRQRGARRRCAAAVAPGGRSRAGRLPGLGEGGPRPLQPCKCSTACHTDRARRQVDLPVGPEIVLLDIGFTPADPKHGAWAQAAFPRLAAPAG